ncbi:hypothetical protein DWUX_1111 [Desulfovibrio diazotrophicus]|nr:hypothetical protein DWUX_1111 [Desulfovibrio diazotrophicus]
MALCRGKGTFVNKGSLPPTPSILQKPFLFFFLREFFLFRAVYE